MRKGIFSTVLLVATATPLLAGENDWRDCTGDDPGRAIAGCTRIIRSIGQTKEPVAPAYYNRGLAYAANGEPDRAIADFNETIRLDPMDADAFISRGGAYFATGDHSRAIANFNEALKLDPINGLAYFNRGLANLYARSLSEALDDLHRATELDPTYPYAALWLDIVERRSELPSHLPQSVSQIDMTEWPAPVIRLYLGQIQTADALAAANAPDAATKKGQACEVNFYSGELALLQGVQSEAIRLFRLAASDCPRTFKEWMAANAELRAFGITSLEQGQARRTNRIR